jgi:hypothetical protein
MENTNPQDIEPNGAIHGLGHKIEEQVLALKYAKKSLRH